MEKNDPPRTKAALKDLFKEWRQDYEAAKVRDEKGEASVGMDRTKDGLPEPATNREPERRASGITSTSLNKTERIEDQSQRIDWRGADLRGVNLQGVNLEGADLRAADLRGVNLSGVNLRYADLRGASLQQANFQNASLYGAKMQGVEAQGADFRGADLRQANMAGAYIEGAQIPPPDMARWLLQELSNGGVRQQPTAEKQKDRGIER